MRTFLTRRTHAHRFPNSANGLLDVRAIWDVTTLAAIHRHVDVTMHPLFSSRRTGAAGQRVRVEPWFAVSGTTHHCASTHYIDVIRHQIFSHVNGLFRRIAPSLGAATVAWGTAAGQTPPPRLTLPTVEVTVTRDAARPALQLPYALSRVQPDSVRPGLRHVSFDEMLLALPGVTVANRNNPTQDPRISIRGFGARSAFGVRGVRIIRDGIPLTLPDGQTPVDYLDLESIGRIEVIRGSAGSL